MYLRYNEDEVDVKTESIKQKKKENDKLKLIIALSIVIYGANYIKENNYFDMTTNQLIVAFVCVLIFNIIIERLRKWISK